MNKPRKMPHTPRSQNATFGSQVPPMSVLQRHCNGTSDGFVMNTAGDSAGTASIVFNRAVSLSGNDGWAMLAPYGRHPGMIHKPDGKRVDIIQVIDHAIASDVAEAFNRVADAEGDTFAGALVDREHFSHMGNGDSTALAWVKRLEVRADGLYGKLDYTAEGERLVLNGRSYKFLSPVFDVAKTGVGNEHKPVTFVDATFTNKPNFRGNKPVVNREGAPRTTEQEEPAATTVAESGDTNMDKFKTMLLKLLGLPDDATDEIIETAAAAMPTKLNEATSELATVKNRVQTLETEKLGIEADAFVIQHAAVIKDPVAVKQQYVLNKAQTIAIFTAVKPAPALRVLNRSEVTPGASTTPATDSRQLQKQQQEVIGQVRNREKCTREMAFTIAQRERPELFPVAAQ